MHQPILTKAQPSPTQVQIQSDPTHILLIIHPSISSLPYEYPVFSHFLSLFSCSTHKKSLHFFSSNSLSRPSVQSFARREPFSGLSLAPPPPSTKLPSKVF